MSRRGEGGREGAGGREGEGEGGREGGVGGQRTAFKIQDAVKTKMQFKGLESGLLPSP